jgi:5-methylcytosine-specific restriction endonuclease McrA
MAQPKKKSLQDVLRERRAAAPLLSARELREREAARRREEVEREAAGLVARWRAESTVVDAGGKLRPAVYAAVFASSRPAYLASKHWSRRSLAQRKAMPVCEVARCGKSEGLHAYHLNRDALGEEHAGSDLMTLCERCLRRAVKLEHERGRPATRAELRALDPERQLFSRAEIAALKEKNSRPPSHHSFEG